MVSSPPKPRELCYLQVANYLGEKLLLGECKPGACLPGQHKLAKELNISLATLQRALHILDHEGFVASKAGHGTFVTLPKERNPAAPFVDDDETVRRFSSRVF